MPLFLCPAIFALSIAASALLPDDNPHLIPKPREVSAGSFVSFSKTIVIEAAANDDDRFSARDLADALRDRGLKVTIGHGAGFRVILLRADSPAAKRVLQARNLKFVDEMNAEGYVLVVAKEGAEVIGASAAGLFYGAQTLKQLIRTDGGVPRVRTAVIRDWPAMKYRGFQDDLSRGPVPTLEFQKKQLRTLAAFKINVFSPYYEHTFEYKSSPLTAPPLGAMTREDARELVAYARRYHMDVIPEQEAFGHLHHVLKYDLYSGSGETDHGHVLAPGDPASLPLIKGWFAELDSIFPSRFVHLGADETFELGLGRTRDRVAKDGLATVYLDFLKQIEAALRPSGKKFLFWGDIAGNAPDLVKTLPRDMIAVAWNYWSFDKFDNSLKPFIDAGLETWVAPGVNGWNRVYPNNDVALRNIQGFVRDGQRLGSTGVINTSWDDDGEVIFNQVWYGLLFGAAASWQKGETSIPDFQASYGIQFHGDASGKIDDAQRKLAAAHAALAKAGLGDGSNALYWMDPYTAEGQVNAQKIRVVSREMRVLAESAMVLVAEARNAHGARLRERDALEAMEMGARRLDFIGMKFQLADEIVRLYKHAHDTLAAGGNPTHDLTEIASSINSRTQDIRDGYVLGRELYERSWKAGYRPYWLYNVLNRYDLAAQLWIQRLDKVNQARATFNRTHTLPNAEEIGIPRAMPGITP
ncbi:MAG TPA: beta-N-acetylhexosaminidase [Gemmatimonadaceae bacterium]|nr:beta-N-acetylhexosaminidase [Gemmatimonadaceae bacterium]